MSADYQRILRELGEVEEITWGWWRHPEAELQVLGEVRGLRILDLGCGNGSWGRQASTLGATVIGIDLSAEQLKGMPSEAIDSAEWPSLIQADAEHLPFARETFDIVVSSWGALCFSDPAQSVPEAATALRPGGRLIVCTWSPIFWLCTAEDEEDPGTQLRRDYFDLGEWRSTRGTVRFQRPYGEWIRLFTTSGLTVERLIEPRPKPGTVVPAHFDVAWSSWIDRFPFDCIWVARKPVETGA